MIVAMMGHVKQLGAHGAGVVDTITGEDREVNLDLYYDALNVLYNHDALSISYNLMIPETDEALEICIFRDGRVCSGSRDAIRSILENEWNMRKEGQANDTQ